MPFLVHCTFIAAMKSNTAIYTSLANKDFTASLVILIGPSLAACNQIFFRLVNPISYGLSDSVAPMGGGGPLRYQGRSNF